MWIGGRSYEKSAYLLVVPAFKKAFSPVFQTDLSSMPKKEGDEEGDVQDEEGDVHAERA